MDTNKDPQKQFGTIKHGLSRSKKDVFKVDSPVLSAPKNRIIKPFPQGSYPRICGLPQIYVEMMGLIGMGNNPMVGATVACAVAVEEAQKA